MKITKLNLANEIYKKLEHFKEERTRYKKALKIASEQLNSGCEKISLTEDSDGLIDIFPLEEFAEFMESKIIKYNEYIKELEIKFKQL